jgi:CIC family chloride channel protein
MVLHSPFPHFMVLDENDFLVGVLSLRDVRSRLADPEYAGDDEVAADIMTKEVITVSEDQNLENAFQQFSQGNFSFLPVLSKNDSRRVVGYLKKDDLLNAYEQHILRGQVRPANRWVSPPSRPFK